MTKHESASDLQKLIFDNPEHRKPTLNDSDEARLFQYYTFPLLGLTKGEMETVAREAGFLDILQKSWFCHSPFLGKPCGRCRPCQIAREERSDIRYSRLAGPYWSLKRGKATLRWIVRRLQ